MTRGPRAWRCCSSRWRPRVGRAADAHPIDAASLTLKEIQPGRFAVRFQTGSPSLQRQLSTAPAVFPPPCRLEGASLECGPPGLVGTIAFPWLEGDDVPADARDRLALAARACSASRPPARRTLTVYGIPAGRAGGSLEPVVADYTRSASSTS